MLLDELLQNVTLKVPAVKGTATSLGDVTPYPPVPRHSILRVYGEGYGYFALVMRPR